MDVLVLSTNAASLAAVGEASLFELLGWDLGGSPRQLFVMLWRLRDRRVVPCDSSRLKAACSFAASVLP